MGLILKCQKCSKVWEYKGRKKFNKKYPQYVSCPTCRSNVKLEETKNDRQR